MHEHDTNESDLFSEAKRHPSSSPMQPQCPSCKGSVEVSAKFCSRCGKTVVRATPPDSTPANVLASPTEPGPPEPNLTEPKLPIQTCEKAIEEPPTPRLCACGRTLVKGAGFCPWCGLRAGDAAPRFRLLGMTPAVMGKAFAITEHELAIGKDPDCGVSITCDDFASRRHARVSQSQGMVFLEDLGSSNGTFLRVRRSVVLEVGDEIAIGRNVFRLENDNGQNHPSEAEACRTYHK